MLMGAFGRRGCGKTTLLIESCYHLAARGRFVLAYDPMHQFPDCYRMPFGALDDLEEVPAICAFSDCEPDDVATLAAETGNCVFACDELDLLCSPNTWFSDAARNIVRRGRHYRVGMIASGLRFANVHRDFLALADCLALFNTEDEDDLRRIGKRVGVQYANRVSGLDQGWFAAYPFGVTARLGGDNAAPLPSA